ncbi:endosomal peripheral membrane protein [Paecilomyces variotii No. 5]|uniref:Endosomal peripheral membrane protein n=1 Tax=Byssochlamys spectabilis (strain No. 5 / NBRC 109023) TaxID=1356009 RepID=V5I5K7_BYSSN|nr:endosomal peripheral membrane protein [Paecilomyces variotii No. 5]
MTSQILQTELSNLIHESKRKNSDLRNAAEQSISDLKALPSTSEAQLTADLIRKPNFVNPFILSCHTRNARLAAIGVSCLQRLATSRAFPAERLKDVLAGLRETTSLNLDVQLKILQTLPSLLQSYSEELSGELLASTLEICAILQASKTAAVSNTAAATLQQLVISAFDKVADEDRKPPGSIPTVIVKVESEQLTIGLAAFDALRILDDLCRLVEGERADFLQVKSLPSPFVLELIEGILTNSGRLFGVHPEQTQVLRNRLMPLTVRCFSERQSFAQTVRVARILLILLKRHMALLVAECEMALGLLIHLLEPDGNAPWKRVLCMEIFRGLHAEPGIIRSIYLLYDANDTRKDIIKEHMASFVRLASEKPSLIGVSHQSTIPSGIQHSRSKTEDQITLEAGGVAGVIGTAVSSADENVPGISNQWSIVRTPYIELLDKADAPSPPETYVYSLVLNCISSFSEGLAKFILPLTVPDLKGKKKRRGSLSRKSSVPVNPLDLEAHPQLEAIKACAGIIDSCWPAALATCSTFLYAALDPDFYHNLVRSFQKLTHVAGLLRQSTPRDAFLTTLAKAAMPSDAASSKAPVPISGAGIESHAGERKSTSESTDGASTPVATSGGSLDTTAVSLSTRNLLCLRALLNLGIALGPTLDQAAWSIVLETLQRADLVMSVSAVVATKQAAAANVNDENAPSPVPDVPKANFGAEIIAVQTAAAKLFESTGDYPENSFEDMLTALLKLSNDSEDGILDPGPGKSSLSPQSPPRVRRTGRIHQSTRSISMTLGKTKVQEDELRFVLEKVEELTIANLARLSSPDDDKGGRSWCILTDYLKSVLVNGDINLALRLRASRVLNNAIFQTMKPENQDDVSLMNQIQLRNLEALKSQVTSLYARGSRPLGSSQAADIDIHEQALETLKSILEQYGESFVVGWDIVFDLISSVFDKPELSEDDGESIPNKQKSRPLKTKSPRLVRTAYKSLQLVASDFLSLLPASCFLELVESFSKFACQDEDFNISLTTTSFFWNVSDFLQGQIEQFSIETHVDSSASDETLTKLAKDSDTLVSRNSLWLLLLLRIVDLATDSRLEIRNSAMRTLLRIFDAYGQQLSSKAWHLCLNRVLFVMFEDIQLKILEVTNVSSPVHSEANQWVETAVVMVKGSSSLIAGFFDTVVKDDQFDQSWERVLEHFKVLLGVKSLELSEAIFSSVVEILARAQFPDTLSKGAVERAWDLWFVGHPAPDGGPLDLDNPNQEALLAYLRSFQQIYRLFKDELSDERIEQALKNMRASVWNSICSRYSVDTDHQSTVQAHVIDCLKAVCVDKESSQPSIVQYLAEFADSALSQWSPDRDKSRPSFIAFSKNAIELLSWYIADFGIKRDIFSNGSLSIALEHLANPIAQKYEWQGKDREPTLWHKSTTTALNILQVAIPYVEKQYEAANPPEVARFWSCVVDIAQGIVSGGSDLGPDLPIERILSDEAFDINAFNRLKYFVVPSLGAPIIQDKHRRDFARAIFRSSLVHPPQRLDLPRGSVLEEPLRDLYKVRPGRTFDPPPTHRSKIAYVLIDTLFDLASASCVQGDDSHPAPEADPRRIAIARSICPFLILRCAISIKSYIADQPLRGLMPQPTSARRELLHLLRQLVDLNSEPAAIPDAPALASSSSSSSPRGSHKKHLGWMYPLVVRAIQVAGKEREDGKVLEALGKVLQEVSLVEEETADSA